MRVLLILALLIGLTMPCQGEAVMTIPEDFPSFRVPGYEQEMESLRALFWLHYPRSGPGATLWDEWLASSSLWPAVSTDDAMNRMRKAWSDALSERIVDAEGYVSSNQHPSIAHQLGWPFPLWSQGKGGFGWHFSFKSTLYLPWRPTELSTIEGWALEGARDKGIGEDGWELELDEANAAMRTPSRKIDTFQSPFIQLRWKGTGLGNAQPYIEWTTKNEPNFGPDRRMYFDSVEGTSLVYAMIPMYKHPKWTGEITRLRVGLGNAKPGGSVTIEDLFTQYDTRQNINSQCFVRGCATYFWWTRDINFLRRNINRMRTALRYVMTEHEALKRKVVFTPWVGHDGRSGLLRESPNKVATAISGRGLVNNYWDLLPFGGLDAYATIQYYDTLKCMVAIERETQSHSEWNIPGGVLKIDPDELLKHAAEVKAKGNNLFWNPKAGRFAAGVDADGKKPDYGFTFLNFEAVYYDFATPQHAREIMSWLCGDRIVDVDTAQGADIYHWRVAPRTTTKRNVDYYVWAWAWPEGIPWGGQIQDGGAALGFSYHDLMARLKTRGPDDAWQRLQEIIRWFDDVQAAGGYRAYYATSREGTLQGGGPPGGLGMDWEFVESVLVPQVVLRGFLGFSPTGDGFKLDPRLPKAWPELEVDRIYFQDLILRVKASRDAIEVLKEGAGDEPCFVQLRKGEWKMAYLNTDGKATPAKTPRMRASDGAFEVDWASAAGVRFARAL